MKNLMLIVLMIMGSIIIGNTQPNTKFGAIKPEDFNIQSNLIDSSSNAIVLFDIGSYDFENNDEGWLNLVYTKHTRIKILNKNGYDVATIRDLLYKSTLVSDEMDDIKASTFNLENNQVVQTKLEKKNISEVGIINNYFEKVFTLPSIREGSIIEYTYTLHKHFYDVTDEWKFESDYPCLYNEFSITIPSFLHYIVDLKTNIKLDRSSSDLRKSFQFRNIAYGGTGRLWSGGATTTKWVGKDIPRKKSENNISSINNYLSKVSFQLSTIQIDELPVINVIKKWEDIFKYLKSNSAFGDEIYATNHWLKEPLNEIMHSQKSSLDSVKYLYRYIRDNYSETKNSGIFITNKNNLKDIYKNKKGSSTDINMLLIAMLKRLGFSAEPVLIRTRDRGYPNIYYPILTEYNYLVASVVVNGDNYLLDASDKYMGFGNLPLKCYNGAARVLGDSTYIKFLQTDSLKESENIVIYVTANDSGKMSAMCTETLGNYSSLRFREKNMNRRLSDISFDLVNDFLVNSSISNLEFDSMKLYDFPVGVNYDASFTMSDDIVYLNPLLKVKIKENPFKSDTRKYPLEMLYAYYLNYTNTIEIPENYRVEEMPKSAKVSLNDHQGLFYYQLYKQDNKLHLTCQLILNKANYDAEDYQYIRDFYTLALKKMNEEIVFKKIK